MASTKELRRRIKSIKNTSQITHAMEMVAATKMRRAQSQALSGRPYSEALHRSLSQLLGRLNEVSHLLLINNQSEKVGIILLSTDKALCGALNTNLFRLLLNLRHSELDSESIKNGPRIKSGMTMDLQNIIFYTIGKKGRTFVVKSGSQLEADFENHEIAHFRNSTQLRKLVVSDFLSGKVGQVYLLYPHFVSTLKQEAMIVNLLPIQPGAILEERSDDRIQKDLKADFLFDVPQASLLEYLLIHHLDIQIFQAILETKASEHSARMMAMKNATDNAKDLVSDLTLTYNGVRQNAITSELAEIVTAGMALE